MNNQSNMKRFLLLGILFLFSVFFARKIHAKSGIEISSLDVSKFPEITVYFKVNGNNVNSLSREGFKIYDLYGNRISPKIFKKNNKTGKKVSSLMIDTSGSMRGRSIEVAKRLSKNFIDDILSNKYNGMDLYEFNTGSSRRGTFQDSRAVLKSVIDQFKAEGGTAIYDTVIEGIYSISLQKGAKSIIVVTDGEDQHSRYGLSDAKKLALEKKVPVYFVQIGNYSRDLEAFANETGGAYYTDNVTNLRKRLNSIFKEGSKVSSLTFVAKNKKPSSEDYINLVYEKGGKKIWGDTHFSSNREDIPLQNRIVKITSSGNKPNETSSTSGTTHFYHPIYAFDNTARSAWVGSKPKNWLKVEFGRTEHIRSFSIRNGFWYGEENKDKSDSYSKWHNRLLENSRAKKIRITTDRGYKKEWILSDPAEERFDAMVDTDGVARHEGETVQLGGIRAKWIKIEILSKYKGSKWENDICISDIVFK